MRVKIISSSKFADDIIIIKILVNVSRRATNLIVVSTINVGF